MIICELDIEKLTDNQMSILIFSDIENNNKEGDCIFVVGSSKAIEYRLPKAVELYNQRRSGKILFSGGVKWDGNYFPEAVALKNEAITLKVTEKDISIEDISVHTIENVLASLIEIGRAHV